MYQRMFPSLKVDIEAELKLYEKLSEKVRPYVFDTVSYLDKALKTGKKVLVEGANAAMLDIDFGKCSKDYKETMKVEKMMLLFFFRCCSL